MNLSYKHDLWQIYRQLITEQITHDIIKEGTIFVLGAGGCNDLDLKSLKNKSNRIILSDIDIKTCEAGVINQGFHISEFEFLQADYTGLSRLDFFEQLAVLVKKGSPVEGVIDYINTSFESIDYDIDLIQVNFDTLIVLPLYTQLVLPQFQSILNNKDVVHYYQEEEIVRITQAFLDRAGIVIQNFNNLLLQLINNNGAQFILLTDILEYQAKDPIFSKLNTSEPDQVYLESLVTHYINEYGHGFGSYGLWHFESLIPVDSRLWFVWPYEEHRKMIVGYVTGQSESR